MRNVLQTVGSKTNLDDNQHLSIHLHQSCSVSFARNVLILEVISSPSFDVSSDEDVNYLWDLWYNAEWPDITCIRFVRDVETLCERDLIPVYSLTSSQCYNLKKTFAGWLAALSSTPMQQYEIIKFVSNQRYVQSIVNVYKHFTF